MFRSGCIVAAGEGNVFHFSPHQYLASSDTGVRRVLANRVALTVPVRTERAHAPILAGASWQSSAG